MEDNKLTLNSNLFESNAYNTIRELWNDQDFADVTLATEDNHQIKAHKVILSSNSIFFRTILLNNPHPNPLIYLKGIRHRELEIIIQYIYLGQCKVWNADLADFFTTGQDLKVNGLLEDQRLEYDIKPDTANIDHEYTNKGLDHTAPIFTDSNIGSGNIVTRMERRGDGKYVCDQCDSNFTKKGHLTRHKQSKHEGVRYSCDQCDYKATQQGHLTTHKQFKHEGVLYVCDQCDYKATWQDNLITHKQFKHEGVRYSCGQCDYIATTQSSLSTHKESKHEGVRYGCDQCDYKAYDQNGLIRHKQSKHEGVRIWL